LWSDGGATKQGGAGEPGPASTGSRRSPPAGPQSKLAGHDRVPSCVTSIFLTDRPGDLDLVSPDQLARVQELRLDLVVVVARE
jgi:hypothetical protein